MTDNTQAVVFVIDCLYANAGGGTEGQFVRLLQAGRELGVDPTVVFLRNQPVHDEIDWPREPVTLGVDSLLDRRIGSRLRRLADVADERHATIVHSYFDDAALLCALLKRSRPDIRFVCSQRSLGDERSWLKKRAMRWAYRQADKVAVNSRGIAARLRSYYAVPDEKIKLVDNLIDLDDTASEPGSPELLARIEELKRNCERLVLSIANLRSIKGISDLIRAAALLPETPGVSIAIIGEGPERRNFERLIEDLGLTSRVFLLGYHRNAAAALEYADIAVLASHSEGGSNAVIEYQLAGLPIVVTDVGGNSDFISHNETGITVPVADPQALADGIHRLAVDRDGARNMGLRARQSALTRFDRNTVLAAHRKIYHDWPAIEGKH